MCCAAVNLFYYIVVYSSFSLSSFVSFFLLLPFVLFSSRFIYYTFDVNFLVCCPPPSFGFRDSPARISPQSETSNCAPSVCVFRRPTLTHSFSREHKNTVTVTPFSERRAAAVYGRVFIIDDNTATKRFLRSMKSRGATTNNYPKKDALSLPLPKQTPHTP